MISRGKVRRSRLFYLRGLKGRSARLDSELYYGETEAVGAADEVAVPETAAADGATPAPVEAKAPKAEKKEAKPAKDKTPKTDTNEKADKPAKADKEKTEKKVLNLPCAAGAGWSASHEWIGRLLRPFL